MLKIEHQTGGSRCRSSVLHQMARPAGNLSTVAWGFTFQLLAVRTDRLPRGIGTHRGGALVAGTVQHVRAGGVPHRRRERVHQAGKRPHGNQRETSNDVHLELPRSISHEIRLNIENQ